MAQDPTKLNPVNTTVKTYPGERTDEVALPTVPELLPQIFKTDTNNKLIAAAMEDLFQPHAMEDLNYSVGRQTTKALINDYLPHATAKRQLEPGLVVYRADNTPATLSADEVAQAWGFNDRTKETPQPVSVLDLPIDPDKFINWTRYYWVEEGLPIIYITGSESETFDIQNDILGKPYYTTITQSNGKQLTLKNGMRIVFQNTDTTLHVNANLDFEIIANGKNIQTLNQDFVAYDKNKIVVTINGISVSKTNYSIQGNSIYWNNFPALGTTIHFTCVDFYVTSDSYSKVASRRWQVDGVGTANGIRLLSRTHQFTTTQYSKATQTLWDKTAVPWDSVEWDGVIQGINAKHYILQQVGAENRNSHSRINVWYHKDAIQTVANYLDISFNDIVTSTGTNTSTSQAMRPIIEFENTLELFNHGTKYRTWPTLAITSTNVVVNDFINLKILDSNTVHLNSKYIATLSKLNTTPDIIVRITSGTNLSRRALNRAELTTQEYSDLIGNPGKKTSYEINNGTIVWLTNPPAVGDTWTIEYRIQGVALNNLRILWLGTGATQHKIINITANLTNTIGYIEEIPENGDAVVVNTPLSSDPNYLNEYHWVNGQAVLAQIRMTRTQQPKFEIYDTNNVKLSDNPNKPLIRNSTIIDIVNGTNYDQESGYNLKFLPSQFSELTSDNPSANAMYDIVYNHTLQNYSYYSSNGNTLTVRGPYQFRRVTGTSLKNELSLGYAKAWFRLKSWAIRTIDNVDSPTVALDASMWPTYNWGLKLFNNRLYAIHLDNFDNVVRNAPRAARGESVNFTVFADSDISTATVSGEGISDIMVTAVNNTLSFVVPNNAPPSIKLTIGNNSVNVQIINAIFDPRNVKISLNGLTAPYSFNIVRNADHSVKTLSVTVVGTGSLEIQHQGNVVDNDHITAIPGLALNQEQDINLGEFSPSRIVKSMISIIRSSKLYATQSWIDTDAVIGANGALMADNSSMRSAWASLRLAPTLQDSVIARSLSSWRWYRKFISKLETNFNLLDFEAKTSRENLDRILEELLLGISYSSPDAVTGMAVSTNAMNLNRQVANGTTRLFAINTGRSNLYIDIYGPDMIYVYVNGTIVSKDNYTIDQTSGARINFNVAPVNGAIIEIYQAGQINVYSGIPASPAKLGLSGLYKPKFVTETWGNEQRNYIQRHDGSRITAYATPDVDSDLRNHVIMELEMRIYNGCLHSVGIQNQQRQFKAYRNKSPLESISRAQLEWYSTNNIDYQDRSDYVSNNPWTWNYNGLNWRGIYINAFDTYQLDVAPWEALGYDTAPSWWNGHYSWVNTNKRLALENALRYGIVSEPGQPVSVNPTKCRKYSTFPVDSNGHLLDPTAWIIDTPSIDDAQQPWQIGSWSPAETAWRRSISGAWAGVLHAIDDYDLSSEFFDGAMNPFVNDSNTNSPTQKGYNTFAPSQFLQDRPTIGIGAVIFEAYREFNLSGQEPLTELMSLDSRLEFGVGGFSDNTMTLKMYYVKYGNGFYIPPEDFLMTLSPGVSVPVLRYSAVRVEKDGVGFRIYGYDPGQRHFTVFKPSTRSLTSSFPGTRTNVSTPNGTFIKYLEWDKIEHTLQYGSYIANKQELFTFFSGLQAYQTSRGLILDQVNSRGSINDWQQAGLDALQWIAEHWGTNHYCIVGVATNNGLKFKHDRGILDRLDANLGRSGKIIFANGRSALASDLLITRDYEANTDMIVPLGNQQIVFVDFATRDYDHIVYINRKTKFGDLIADFQLGNRLDVLTLAGRRTSGWTGRPTARGVVIQPTGLLPGFDALMSDILDSHKPEQNAFDSLKTDIAKSDVVPDRYTIVDELIQAKNTQHLYKQGLQTAMGTNLAFDALFRNRSIDIPGKTQDITINEEWLITTGEFGNLHTQKIWEIELRKEDFTTNRQVIRFSKNGYSTLIADSLNDNIIDLRERDGRWVTQPATPYGFAIIDRATQTSYNTTKDWLPNAGVAELFDVDIKMRDLTNLTIGDIIKIDQSIKPTNATINSSDITLTTNQIFTTNGFSIYQDYLPGDLTWQLGTLYRATAKITGSSTSVFDSTQWEAVSIDSKLLPSVWVSDYGYNINTHYLGSWTQNTHYVVGDLIENDGHYNVCIANHTSGSSFVNNTLEKIFVNSSGTGYQIGDLVKTTINNTQRVIGNVATVINGKITEISVNDTVGQYNPATTIITVVGGNGKAELSPHFTSEVITHPLIGQIDSISLPVGSTGIGNNYFADSVQIIVNSPTGTGATVTPVLSDNIRQPLYKQGVISTFTIDNGGSGYKVNTIVTLVNPIVGADNARFNVTEINTNTATANSSTVTLGTIANPTILNGGSGYEIAPTVTIQGNGTGAHATAILTSGSVTGITIDSSGTGYTGTVTFTIAAPTTGSIKTVQLAPNVSGVGYGGQSYAVWSLQNPTIYATTSTSGSGATAKVTAVTAIDLNTTVIRNGVITGFQISTPGKNYDPSTTTLSINRLYPRATANVTNGVITSVDVSAEGQGSITYASDIKVSFQSRTGTGATATANIVNGKLQSITVTSGGQNYLPGFTTVVITDPEWVDATSTGLTYNMKAATTVTETVNGIIDKIFVVDGGSNYTTSSQIIISDSARSSLLAPATATVNAVANGAIGSINVTDTTTNFIEVPTVNITSTSGSGAVLIPQIFSYWRLKTTGYSWNILQSFGPMYIEEICPNAINPGLSESKVTFTGPHGMHEGDYIVISGANDGNYSRVHRIKAVVDDYNLLIPIRSTSDNIIYNTVAFKMLPTKFDTLQEYQASLNTYNWAPGMKAYIDNDGEASTNFNYNCTVYEIGAGQSGETILSTQLDPYLIDTNAIYKAQLLDETSENILTTLEVFDPFKGNSINEMTQYINYQQSIDPAIYNVNELGILNQFDLQSWNSRQAGQLWWDTSRVRYVEYEQGTLNYRIDNWGKQFADSEVVVYQWVSSTTEPDLNVPGIYLDDSSGVGQVRYTVIDELQTNGSTITTYYYWQRGLTTVPDASNRPYSAAVIKEILNDPDANGISWISPVQVIYNSYTNNASLDTPVSASILISNINEYFATRDRLILRIEQNKNPEQKHTTGTLLTEGLNGSLIPEYPYQRLRDSLVGADNFRTLATIKKYVPGNSYAYGDIITFVDLNTIDFTYTASYGGSDVPVLPTITAERNAVKFAWNEAEWRASARSNLPFGIFKVALNIGSAPATSFVNGLPNNPITTLLMKRLALTPTAIVKDVLEDNNYYAVLSKPRHVPDITLHPLRRYGNNYSPKPQSWFKDITAARRTFVDAVNDYLLKVNVTGKTNWNANLITWKPLLGDGSVDVTKYWYYTDYSVNGYAPGNEAVKVKSLSELSSYNNPTRFALLDSTGLIDAVYDVVDLTTNEFALIYKRNGTIQLNQIWQSIPWDDAGWDVGAWDLGYFDIVMTALREDIFVGTDIGYFNLVFFAMLKESLVQNPTADWAFKTTYLSLDSTSNNSLNEVALFYDKKDTLIKQYINEVKPYHSQIVDRGTVDNSLEQLTVGIDESMTITVIGGNYLSVETPEAFRIDRQHNGTTVTDVLKKRIVTETGLPLLLSNDAPVTQTVTEEG